MAYVPDPTDTTRPVDADPAESAQAEFRALKAYIAGLVGLGTGINFFRKNLLLNGDFQINQRAPATNADDTYAHDGWYALTQANPIALTSVADAADGFPVMARLTQANAAAQRMGYAQIIEGKDCRQYRGQQVTFNINLLKQSTAATVRFAVLEWTGAVDAVTSDVVNDWTSAVYTPGNFFNAVTLLVSGTSSQALLAGIAAPGVPLTVTLGATFNNLIVIVWTDATVVQNVTLDLGQVQLERGGAASAYEFLEYTDQLLRCFRYCNKFPQSGNAATLCNLFAYTVDTCFGTYVYPVPMRVAPVATFSAGTASGTVAIAGASVGGLTALDGTSGAGVSSMFINFGKVAAFTAGQAGAFQFTGAASVLLEASL